MWSSPWRGSQTAIRPCSNPPFLLPQYQPMVLWAKKELGLEFIRREW